jgi:hypothetical protein
VIQAETQPTFEIKKDSSLALGMTPKVFVAQFVGLTGG